MRPSEIPGWADFGDLYAAWVRRLPEDAQVVELGSFVGASAARWCHEARLVGKRTKLTCYDIFTGIPDEFIVKPEWKPIQAQWLADGGGSLKPVFDRNVAEYGDQIDAHVCDSLSAAKRHADGSLDAVFVDDDHTEAHLRRELPAWWRKLKPGGWFAGHDYDWPSVQEAVNRWSAETGVPVLRVSERSWQMRKPGPVTSWSVPPEARKALVAVCSNERTIFRQTAESLVRLGWGGNLIRAMQRTGFVDIQFAWFGKHPRVDAMRDEALAAAIRLQCSHLVMLDADMTWPTDTLARLLAHHDAGVVSGLYLLKRFPHRPVAFHKRDYNEQSGAYDYHYDLDALGALGLRRELLIGMGCALIPTLLGYVLPRPWFYYQRPADTGLPTITEDVGFCEDVVKAGCPIWLDPEIVCHHLNVDPIGEAAAARALFDLEWVKAKEAPPLPHEVQVVTADGSAA